MQEDDRIYVRSSSCFFDRNPREGTGVCLFRQGLRFSKIHSNFRRRSYICSIKCVSYIFQYLWYTRSNTPYDDVFRTLLNDCSSLILPVMKVQHYTIEEIFEKNLLFLIPFYIFTHEKRFPEYERDRKRLEQMKQEYDRIKEKLEESLEQGAISEYAKCTIMDMSSKVLEHIAKK